VDIGSRKQKNKKTKKQKNKYFFMNNIVNQKNSQTESLGEKLQKIRVERNISLEQASKDLNIPFKYLEDLENNNLSSLPSQAYLKKILKLYCRYLRLDFSACWRAMKKFKVAEAERNRDVNRKYFLSWPKFIRRMIIILLILAVLFFLVFKIKEIFIAPPLDIIQPTDGLIINQKQIEIIGQSQPEVEVTINNENILVDDQGNFQTTMDLQKGLNLIKITAKKRYSQIKEVEIRVLLKETTIE